MGGLSGGERGWKMVVEEVIRDGKERRGRDLWLSAGGVLADLVEVTFGSGCSVGCVLFVRSWCEAGEIVNVALVEGLLECLGYWREKAGMGK